MDNSISKHTKIGNNLLVPFIETIEVFLNPNYISTEYGTEYSPVNSMDEAIALLGGGDTLPTDATIWVMGTITVTTDTTWDFQNLTLKRYKGFIGTLVKVTGDSTLTLKNITIDGQGGISPHGGNIVATSPLIHVDTGSTLNLTNATLQNNKNTPTGGDGGDGRGGGGGVFLSGTFNMGVGGRITNNTAIDGGGVYVASDSTFNMTGGTISDNTALDDGGGVFVASDSTFNRVGGTIESNTATNGDDVHNP